MLAFAQMFKLTRDTRVLDVGGSAFNWTFLSERPRLTFLNIAVEYVGTPKTENDTIVVGDGCDLPFGSKSFDLVFSNSVIEHLHSHDRQLQFAREIDRVGNRYFVQTPNYWFPLEPHYLAPFVQFVPIDVRSIVGKYFTPWGWIQRPSPEAAAAFAREIRLLRKRELQLMFADGEVIPEKLGALVKSWIAIKM